MTVTSEVSRSGPYNGNGSTTVFPYEFKIFTAADLLVTEVDLDGIETTLVNGVDYTVDGVLSDDGGDVTLTTALAGDGTDAGSHKLTIRRVLDATQTMNLRSQGKISAEVLERAHDRAIMLIQQLIDERNRSLRLIESEAGSELLTLLPALADRKGRSLAFDNVTGQPTTMATATTAISSAMQDVVTAASLAAGRSAMGVNTAAYINVQDSPYLAVGDASTDDTAAIAAAISAASAAGGGTVYLLGKFRITSQITVPARVKLLGAGSLTSDSATRSPSTIIKDFNGIGVLFSGDDSGTEGIHYDSTAAKTGDLVQVTGSRWNAPSLAVTNAGQDGLRIGATEAGASSINANLWSIGFIAALSNGRYGINIDHTNTSTSSSFPAGAPDCNAGALVRADVRGNTSDGIRFGNTIDNWCGMLCVQSNTGYGIRFAAYARNNIISKSYTEGNTAGDGIIDSLATQNVVWAARAITLTAGWTNNGSASNAIFQHHDAVGDGDFNNAPWYWPGDFNQAGLPIGSVTRHRQYVSANYNYGEWRTETDGTDGTKVVINTRKTGVGQRDVLATDEDGRVFVKIAGASLVLGPDAANYAQVFSGFGTPEGVVTAERGSLFCRMDGGAGTCLYVKQTGSGNTGWVGK